MDRLDQWTESDRESLKKLSMRKELGKLPSSSLLLGGEDEYSAGRRRYPRSYKLRKMTAFQRGKKLGGKLKRKFCCCFNQSAAAKNNNAEKNSYGLHSYVFGGLVFWMGSVVFKVRLFVAQALLLDLHNPVEQDRMCVRNRAPSE